MSSFLESLASDLLARFGTDLSRVAVVFPNKRASLFLNDYLARQAGRPLWSPAYITISDLFRSHSQLKVADPILLVCKLHKCFTQCTGINETLDHFYGWGQLLLSDFDDLDKNMGPADRVFANLRDIHELDDVSYLTAEQRVLIQRFFSNFSEEHNSELKQRFLRLWSRIGEIYHTFNRQLADEGLTYEGALYRQVAEDETIAFEYDTYVFVGFNLLQQVEQTLFRRLEREGKALFYQDTEEQPPRQLTFISAPTENIQARYVSQWLDARRIADGRRTAVVLCNEGLLQAVIHCLPDTVDKVNVTTGYPLLQTPVASLVTQLLNLQINGWSVRTQAFRRRWLEMVTRHPYATLLPEGYADSHLTDSPSLLHWLLGIVRHIASSRYEDTRGSEGAEARGYENTRGCGGAEARGYENTRGREGAGVRGYEDTPSSDISRTSAPPHPRTFENDPLTSEALFRMYTLLNRMSDLTDSGILTVDVSTLQRLIAQVVQSTSIPFHGEPAEGIQIMGVLETRNLDFDHVLLLSCNEGYMPRGVNDTSFIPYAIRKAYGLTTVDQKVAIYEHYFHRLLQRADDVTIVYNNATVDAQKGEMSRFMLQLLIDSFQGHENTRGYEGTGARGYENTILRGCEGTGARGYEDTPSSDISRTSVPPRPRTPENNPYPPEISFRSLKAGQQPLLRQPQPIEKTPAVLDILRQRFSANSALDISHSSLPTPHSSLHTPHSSLLTPHSTLHTPHSSKTGGISPTAVCSYLRCQLRFFYRYVSNLQEPDETDDELIDNRLFGNIFHKAAQTLYEQFVGRRVTTDLLDAMLNDKSAIERAVDAAISSELYKDRGCRGAGARGYEDTRRYEGAGARGYEDTRRCEGTGAQGCEDHGDRSRDSLGTSDHGPVPMILDGLQLINREVIIRYMRLLVETDRRLAPFTILHLEHPVYMPWGDTRIGGIIDRLDCVTDPVSGEERIRVIDYKTGARHLRPMPDVDAIFDPAQIPNHSDYYLQAFLYSHIVSLKHQEPVSPALLFIQHAAAEGYDPTLVVGRERVTDITVHADRFISLLKEKTGEIFSPGLPFVPTDDRNRCRSCPYAALCGR